MDESFEMAHQHRILDDGNDDNNRTSNVTDDKSANVVWNNFEQISVVGKGSFGTAILCRRKKDDKLVILKEINLSNLNAFERRNAKKEADLLSILHHINIVSYFGCYGSYCQLLIEMEYCEDGTLATFLSRQKHPLLETDILSVFRQIACALEYLDDKNILHRDLKTGNIFITHKTIIKLGDFGIAKILSTTTPAASTVIGTPCNFSPEVCQGRRYTKKSDIWAAGCVLYELTCLKKTFEGSTLPALIQKIVKGQFAPIRSVYSTGLKRLIHDLLQKDPDLRPRAFEIISIVDNLLMDACLMRLKMTDPFSGSIFTQQILHQFNETPATHSILFKLTIEPYVHLQVINDFNDLLIRYISISDTHMLLVTESNSILLKDFKNNSLTYISQHEQKNIIKVAAGNNFSIFLTDNGLIFTSGTSCLGRDEDRLSNLTLQSKGEIVSSLLEVDIIDIAAGSSHVLACSRNGDVYVWGDNKFGELGIGDKSSHLPMQLLFPRGVKIIKVFAGQDASAFIDTKYSLWLCGSNVHGKLSFTDSIIHYPCKVTLIKSPVVSVTLGTVNSVVVLTCGRIITFGIKYDDCNTQHSLGNVISVACGSSFILTCNTESELYFWGRRKRSNNNQINTDDKFKYVDDLLIGNSDVSLMQIVSQQGPDHPVMLVREPKSLINNIKQLITATDNTDYQIINKPSVIVAVYGSQAHLKFGEGVILSQVVTNSLENSCYLLIEKTAQKISFASSSSPSSSPVACCNSKNDKSVRFTEPSTIITRESIESSNNSTQFDHTMTWIQKEFNCAIKNSNNDEKKKNYSFSRSTSDPSLYSPNICQSLQREHSQQLQINQVKEEINKLKSQLLDLRSLNFELQEETVRLRQKESLRTRDRRFSTRWLCCMRV